MNHTLADQFTDHASNNIISTTYNGAENGIVKVS